MAEKDEKSLYSGKEMKGRRVMWLSSPAQSPALPDPEI